MRVTATLLLLAALGLVQAVARSQDQTVLERRVAGPVESIVVENPRGETAIESWPERDVRVVAVRPGAKTGHSLASDVSVEWTGSSALLVSVSRDRDDSEVNLRIFVPLNTRVTLGGAPGSPRAPAAEATRPRRARATTADVPVAVGAVDDAPVELDASLVNLDVRVTDATGAMLTNLTEQDFQIFENGKPQPLVHFQPIAAPVNLVLLLDLSGSTKEKVEEIKRAALTFVDSLGTQNSIAVAAFTRKFLLVSSFTSDRALLRQRVSELQARDSGTAYYDSFWTALELFEEIGGGRRVVVVLTDGVDNTLSDPGQYTTRHAFAEMLDLAVRTETTVFPIYYDTEYDVVVKRGLASHEAYVTARRELDRLARETGGTVFRADRTGDLESAYRQVSDEVRSIYSVAYESSNPKRDGAWRTIEVRVRRPGAIVKARPGYNAR